MYPNKNLKNSGFSENSLTKFRRPTTIILASSLHANFSYLDQKIFQLFLRSYYLNKIQLYEGSLNCNDCRNHWLQNDTSLKQVINSSCSNMRPLNDPINFIGCTGANQGAVNYVKNKNFLKIIIIFLIWMHLKL